MFCNQKDSFILESYVSRSTLVIIFHSLESQEHPETSFVIKRSYRAWENEYGLVGGFRE